MKKLTFLDPEYMHMPIRNFWNLRDHNLPKSSGAYVLIAKPGMKFTYPHHSTTIFYIGQSKNLQRRLLEHLKYAEEAKLNRKLTLYHPRYEYAASFASSYTYILTNSGETPKELEEDVLACFAEHYRSWPVANSGGSWKALLPLDEWKKRHIGS